jgi:hypothetical protein
LLATANGTLTTAIGIALLELSCIGLIASVFRRVGDGEADRGRRSRDGKFERGLQKVV